MLDNSSVFTCAKKAQMALRFGGGFSFMAYFLWLAYPHAMDNVRARSDTPFERLQCLDVLDRKLLEKGAVDMAQHRAVVVGVAPRDAPDLSSVIKHIEHAGKFFRDHRVVVVDIGSADNVKSALVKWQARNRKVKIVASRSTRSRPADAALMGDARNHYLDELDNSSEYKAFDMMLVVELALPFGWDMRGLFHSFAQRDRWEAVCANGVQAPSGRPQDAGAYRALQAAERPWSGTLRWSGAVAGSADLVRVASCFGGVALYKRSAVGQCRYWSAGEVSEHVFFHACLRANRARLALNPAQVVRLSQHADPRHLQRRLVVLMAVFALLALVCAAGGTSLPIGRFVPRRRSAKLPQYDWELLNL